jgi:hypothetical protein
MIKTLLLAFGLFAAAAQAATPREMSLEYDLYRNGLKFGQVTDTFTRGGDRYTLTSETRASGPLKALWPGSIRLESTGEITRQGLRPEQFLHARSDSPHKLARARLDWKQRSIAWQYKGESWTADGLLDGAQDQLSQVYQFMFAPAVPADYRLQVVSGRNINEYRYARSEGGAIETPLGPLLTQQYQRITRQADEKAVTVWVAPARNNLPVQIRVSEDGVILEQRLVRASVRD